MARLLPNIYDKGSFLCATKQDDEPAARVLHVVTAASKVSSAVAAKVPSFSGSSSTMELMFQTAAL